VDAHQRLCPNESEVAAKVIDGEVIIIRLSDGLYYSISGAGCLVWELIERRRTVGEILEAVAARHDAPDAQVRDDVASLLAELSRERLVTSTTEAGPALAAGPPANEGKAPYEAPVLQKYQDMADLLALDPPAPGLAKAILKDPGRDE
jgi:hypothetical protein